MNALWGRAEKGGHLTSLFKVLDRELDGMLSTKNDEIARFRACEGDAERLCAYQRHSGLTLDECARILQEIQRDKQIGLSLMEHTGEKNAIDGERSLKSLYNAQAGVPVVWTKAKGQKPTDLIVVGQEDTDVLLGDCKFGLRNQSPYMMRNPEEFSKAFSQKFEAVSDAILRNDGVSSLPVMLLIVTSALAPLLKNRIDDYKLDPQYSAIPYDRVIVCCVDDIYPICKRLLAEN